MRWGVAFNVPATQEAELWGLPPPSQMETVTKWDGTKMKSISNAGEKKILHLKVGK